MMINFENYDLIKTSEDIELFDLQQSLLADSSIPLGEKITRLAIILIQNPVGDYQTAIDLLNDFSQCETSFQALFLGAFFDAQWPFIEPNPFLPRLDEIYQDCDSFQRALIKFIKAIDIDNILYAYKENADKAQSFLADAIDLYNGFAYAYYRLALISKREIAKSLLEKTLASVQIIYSTEELAALPMSEVVSYDFFIKMEVIGTNLTLSNYNEMKSMYHSM